MGTIKAKTKEDIIKFRKENSQWGWVWNNKKEQYKRLIIGINTVGSCRAVNNESLENYYEGNFYVVTIWENYELIEEAKPTVYRPWTNQPFPHFINALTFEFRRINSNQRCISIGISDTSINLLGKWFSFQELYDIWEYKRTDKTEWLPCGELSNE